MIHPHHKQFQAGVTRSIFFCSADALTALTPPLSPRRPPRLSGATARPHSFPQWPHPPSSPPTQRRRAPALAAGQCAAHRSHPHGTGGDSAGGRGNRCGSHCSRGRSKIRAGYRLPIHRICMGDTPMHATAACIPVHLYAAPAWGVAAGSASARHGRDAGSIQEA